MSGNTRGRALDIEEGIEKRNGERGPDMEGRTI